VALATIVGVLVEVPVMLTLVRIANNTRHWFMGGGSKMAKPKVAFICVYNSCRSQIAEALGKHLAADVFESYSAGTETKPRINQDAIRLMKQLHGIDMGQTQHSKPLLEIPPVDIVVTMGCNVACPHLPCKHREDWGLYDPTGKDDEAFITVIRQIETKIKELSDRIRKKLIYMPM